MSKKKSKDRAEATPSREAPTFRPLAAQLEALAKKAKAEAEAEAKAKATAKPAAVAKPSAKSSPSSNVRESTLTAAERRELKEMESPRDDEFFFQRLMSGVTPLDGDKRGRIGTAPPKVEARKPAVESVVRDPDQEVRDHLMNLVEGAARFEVSDDGKRLEGRRLDLDMGTMRRVRRGELPIDARIDLHGKRSDEARDALDEFLRAHRARRDRLVLVIHGRGEHSPAGIGVLRGEIGAWLSQGRASQHVAAFSTAQGDDGGEGALYVLLRS